MSRIILCIFLVLLLFFFPASSVGADREAISTFESLVILSEASPSPATPVPGGETPAAPASVILSPSPGQALQGNVPVVARTAVEGFVSFELSFAYFNNPTGAWFPIYEGSQPVVDGELARWDTTTITDGVYTLRLVVYRNDGSQQTATVPGVRVRNYTPVETDTPDPAKLTETVLSRKGTVGTPPVTSTFIPPTPTPFPPNPAEINQQEVFDGVLKGALAVLGLFALGILYRLIHTFLRNHSAL